MLSALLVYGATGSGKTFSMFGSGARDSRGIAQRGTYKQILIWKQTSCLYALQHLFCKIAFVQWRSRYLQG